MSGFSPGKATITNQHLTVDGNGRIRPFPGYIHVRDTAWNWRRTIDNNVHGGRKLPGMELLLKETSLSTGLDNGRPRDVVYFGGPGNTNAQTYNRFAVLCQSATNTVLFCRSLMGGQVYKTANLTGTAAGWTGITCAHRHNDPAGNYNYFFAYNRTDGNLVKFVETAGGISVIETLAVGSLGGSRKPLFDGVALWMVGGNNLKRIDGVFLTTTGMTQTTVASGTSWNNGMLAIDQGGGGVYAYRAAPSPNAIVRASTTSPYTVSTVTNIGGSVSQYDMGFDGRFGLWKQTLSSVQRVSVDKIATGSGAVTTGTDAELVAFDNQTTSFASMAITDLVYGTATVSSSPNLVFTQADLMASQYSPVRPYELGNQVSFAYRYGRSHIVATTQQMTGVLTTAHSTLDVLPGVTVPEVSYIAYNSTPNSNAQIFSIRWTRDSMVRNLHVNGGWFLGSHDHFPNTLVSLVGRNPPAIVFLSGGQTVRLPARPSASMQITVKLWSGAGTTTVATTDGTLIDGSTTNTMTGAFATRTYLYSRRLDRWTVIG